MRWGYLIVIVLVAVIGIAGWFIWALGKMVGGDPPNSKLPQLVRDIPASDSKLGSNNAGPIFRRRVEVKFPPGSSAHKMVVELRRQGFSFYAKNGETTASFTQWGIIRRDWWITWKQDDKGQIRVIRKFETWAGL